MACFLVFSVQLGIQTLPLLLSGELFPSDVRAFGKGLARSATCGFMVISLKVYPILSANLGIHGTFLLFSVVLLLSLPIVYCILPETKDLGLEMIQTYFMPNRTVFYVDLTDPNLKTETNHRDLLGIYLYSTECSITKNKHKSCLNSSRHFVYSSFNTF